MKKTEGSKLNKSKKETEKKVSSIKKGRKKVFQEYTGQSINKNDSKSKKSIPLTYKSIPPTDKYIPPTYKSIKEMQDIEARYQYLGAITNFVDFKSRCNKKLLNFYIKFIRLMTFIIAVGIFMPYFPLKLKEILCGGFFANVVSILIIMVKSSFSPIDTNIINAFKELNNEDKSKKGH